LRHADTPSAEQPYPMSPAAGRESCKLPSRAAAGQAKAKLERKDGNGDTVISRVLPKHTFGPYPPGPDLVIGYAPRRASSKLAWKIGAVPRTQPRSLADHCIDSRRSRRALRQPHLRDMPGISYRDIPSWRSSLLDQSYKATLRGRPGGRKDYGNA
jgi:hypothetical protein